MMSTAPQRLLDCAPAEIQIVISLRSLTAEDRAVVMIFMELLAEGDATTWENMVRRAATEGVRLTPRHKAVFESRAT